MKLLIVDDDPNFNKMLHNYLLRNNYEVFSAHSSNTALDLINKEEFNLVLTDYKLPGLNGLELIEKIKQLYPNLPVILITNYSNIRTAVNSIKLGAYEFITKPIIPDELLKTIKRAIQSKGEIENAPTATSKNKKYIQGKTKASLELWKHVALVANTKMSVLISGDSGTGKEYVARKIHENSRRSNMPFVAIDCGVLSKELAASELFGHFKGAFTGAFSDKKGHFEIANGGTLFLDEIGNLSYDVQIQLLRVLQEEVIRPMGGDKEVKVDVRIIAATNDKLNENIEQDKFRNDLFHRLNEFQLFVPSLKERIDDITEFCEYFISEANIELNKNVQGIDDEVLKNFMEYHWPGNLRELKNIIKRAVLLCEGNYLGTHNLPHDFIKQEVIKDNLDRLEKENDQIITNSIDLKGAKSQQEKLIIEKALKQCKFNKSKTAKLLKINRTTLYNKINEYNIDA